MGTKFIEAFNEIAEGVHTTAKAKGWWENRNALESAASLSGVDGLLEFAQSTNDASCLALIHSEVSEALENIRHGSVPDDKIPEFSGVEAELADIVVRIMDVSQARGWRVAEALVAKIEFNKTREHLHGGKAI